MLNKFFISFFILASFLYAEKSVFGAGDLNSPAPYGLTPAEKVIVKNKKTVKKNEKKINKVDTKINEIYDRIDGLESLFEGEGSKLNKLSKDYNNQITQLGVISSKTTSHDEQIKLLQEDFLTLKVEIEQNTENIKTLKESFDKIVKLANEINKNYVTKKEFNKLLSMLDKKQVSSKSKSSTGKVPKKSAKALMKDVRVLFKKDHFTKAIPIIEHLIKIKHRPAENNYYLGEINYYRKNYKDALHYFKTSMMLYDKASYLPKLLLHSAISFEKTGDNENAQNFYNTVVDIYPNSQEAKIAFKKIK